MVELTKRFKKKIKTQFQYWGWFTQLIPEFKIQFFPSGKHLGQHLLKMEKKEAYEEFKRLSAFISDANNIKYYEELLRTLYPTRKQIPETSRFVAKGDRANRNRYIRISGHDFFEKNYSHKRHQLESIIAFEEHLYPLVSSAFNLPSLCQVFEGEFSSLLYFDYFELEVFETENRDEALIQMAHNLYHFSIEKDNELQTLDLPPILLDYEKLFYSHNIEKANLALKKEGLNSKKLSQSVKESKRILTHGDLHIENVFRDNTLIDLDNFGYYPIGMDAAFIYMFYFEERKSHASLLKWATDHFSKVIVPHEWSVFEKNFMFYIFLFLQMRTDISSYPDLEKQLLTYLKNIS